MTHFPAPSDTPRGHRLPRANLTNFVRLDLGPTEEYVVPPFELPTTPLPEAGSLHYAVLKDGPRLRALGFNWQLELDLPPHVARTLRRLLKEGMPLIVRLKVEEIPERMGMYSGILRVTRLTRVRRLPGPLILELAPEVTLSPDDLVNDLQLPWLRPEGPGFEVTSAIPMGIPAMLISDDDRPSYLLRTMRDKILKGKLIKQSDGARLRITEVTDGHVFRDEQRKGSVQHGFSLLEIEDMQVIAAGQSGPWMEMASCEALELQVSPVMKAWLRYEELDQQLAKERLKRRMGHPLRFVQSQQTSETRAWKLKIQSTREALEAWIGDEERDQRDVEQSVELASGDGGDTVTAVLAGIQEIQLDQGQAIARVILKEGKPGAAASNPVPVTGTIHAIDSWQNNMQYQRKERAMARLVSGTLPNPHLPVWLANPVEARVEAPERFETRTQKQPLNPDQARAVGRALTAPDVYLVQGPPGTGKTSVIVELIAQLALKTREDRPLRILVSAIQNDAVDNVIAKLQKVSAELGLRLDASLETRGSARRAATDEEIGQIREALLTGLEADPEVRYRVHCAELRHQFERLDADIAQRRAEVAISLLAAEEALQQTAEALTSILMGSSAEVLTASAKRELEASLANLSATSFFPQSLTPPGEEPASNEPNAPSTLLQLLGRPLDARTAESFLALETSECDVDHPEASMLMRRLTRELKLDLSRGNDVSRLASRWSELGELLGGGTPFMAAPLEVSAPDPLTEARLRLLELISLLREQQKALQEREDAPATSPGLIRYRLAQQLGRRPTLLNELNDKYHTVVGLTCQRADTKANIATKHPYDLAIIDEAGRGSPTDLLIPMTLARRCILIGDQHQLPPSVDEELGRALEADEHINLEQETFFGALYERLPLENRTMLSIQYRMHEAIGNLVSELFYNQELRSHYSGALASQRRSTLGLFGNTPMVWIDTSEQLGSHEIREVNPLELELIDRMLSELAPLLVQSPEKQVGIIAFYKRQAAQIQTLLLPRENRPDLRDLIEVGTVDAFQGKEFPLVILSTVRHNVQGRVGFLSLPNRINVAFSRAQRQLIILGSRTTFDPKGQTRRGSSYLDRAARYCATALNPDVNFIPSHELRWNDVR